MTATGLWLRLVGSALLAAGLVVAVSPALPPPAVAPGALALGVVAGLATFRAVARIPLPLPLPLAGVLVVAAGAEEVIWRWFALGELAQRTGPAVALTATSIAFGAVHPGRRLQHVCTGVAFGAVFLATGSLLAAWAAHAAYNLSVAAAARSVPQERG
jgi:membrane protease YdiL (CAAX protease family)